MDKQLRCVESDNKNGLFENVGKYEIFIQLKILVKSVLIEGCDILFVKRYFEIVYVEWWC